MFDLSSKLLRQSILTTIIALSMTTVATAQNAVPATGLGQAWPNASDVSTNPHYHVYRFERDGIVYIQINDLQGNVHAAIATTAGVTFALPIGADAQNVAVTTGISPTDLTQAVYRDDSLTVTAVPQSDGSVGIMAMALCGDPRHCSGGGIVSQQPLSF
ncbi:hypothetical protein [Dyella nitratireducens]|uniref:Uncharacterized protein n=1 Tax=Dyella nitratireducens TaxID=1849580 RepID=A0ABQ1FQ49_9GAMM|nr:hypothetical protein [Dyella nitratireducens]GGA26021.1 hypothetical protein GCM10010981_13320 [Dyella nitratireducens]GLQ43604.1 hypothetical protein GCM10007902_34540 [Dyella nitratireducens]